MADEVAPILIDLTKFDTEALILLACFFPDYAGGPEVELGEAVFTELIRRHVVTELDEKTVSWDIDEATRVEVLDLFHTQKMLEEFRDITESE